MIDANDQTVSRVDASEPGDPQTFSTGSTPTDIAVGAGCRLGRQSRRRPVPEERHRVDPESRAVVETIDLLPRKPPGFVPGFGFSRQHIAVTRDGVWAINPDLTVSRIDPRTNRVVARIRGVAAANIAAGGGGVWVVDGGERIAEIDPRTNAVARKIDVDAESLAGLAVGAGAVWVTDPEGGTVTRIDPAQIRTTSSSARSRSTSGWAGSPTATGPSGRRTRSPTASTGSIRTRTQPRSSTG